MKEAAQTKMRGDERMVGYESPEKEQGQGAKKADTKGSSTFSKVKAAIFGVPPG